MRKALAYPGIAAEMITGYYSKSDCSDPRISEDFTIEEREKCFSGTLKETGEDERTVARKAVPSRDQRRLIWTPPFCAALRYLCAKMRNERDGRAFII